MKNESKKPKIITRKELAIILGKKPAWSTKIKKVATLATALFFGLFVGAQVTLDFSLGGAGLPENAYEGEKNVAGAVRGVPVGSIGLAGVIKERYFAGGYFKAYPRAGFPVLFSVHGGYLIGNERLAGIPYVGFGYQLHNQQGGAAMNYPGWSVGLRMQMQTVVEQILAFSDAGIICQRVHFSFGIATKIF